MITASYYNYAMMLEKKVIKHEKYDKSQINLGGLVASNSYKKINSIKNIACKIS